MSLDVFKKRIEALSGEHSLEIIIFLRDRGWSIALDVAKVLHIHPTTVTRYLSKMCGAGILIKRAKRCRTGDTFEYKLSSQKIAVSLDLGNNKINSNNVCPALDLISNIIDKLDKIGNPLNPEIFKGKSEEELVTLIISGKEQKAASLAKENSTLPFKVLKGLLEFSEKSLGKTVTKDIVLSASRSLPSSMAEFVPDYVQEVLT